MAPILRMVQTDPSAIGSWRSNFLQLRVLFEVEGFEDFMNVIATNLLRDNKHGLIFRVGSGAFLSTLDAVTDFYTISTYCQSEDLAGQADAFLVMICLSLLLQLLMVLLIQYRKKSKRVKLKEALITIPFLRPAMDAYRVNTNHEDEETVWPELKMMVHGKAIELATEAIPGCVLQLFVWLSNPEQAGTYDLASIAISAATTGFSSTMISFDMDVDVPYRKNQPKFYGYIPDDNGLRGRYFMLMT